MLAIELINIKYQILKNGWSAILTNWKHMPNTIVSRYRRYEYLSEKQAEIWTSFKEASRNVGIF